MGRHRDPGPGRDRRPERRQLVSVEVRARATDHGPTVMRVVGRCPQPREVLDRGGHPGRLQPADHRRPVPPDRRRVVPERARAHRRVRRFRGEVDGRRVDQVHAHRPRLASDRGADAFGQPLVVRGAQGHVPGEPGRPVAEADQLAALLVRAHQQRSGEPRSGRLERIGQLADLPGRADVVRHEQRHPRRGRTSQSLRHPVGHALALEREHHPLEDPVACRRVGHPLTAPARPRTK